MSECKYGCKRGKVYVPKLKEFIDCPLHGVKKGNLEKVEVYEGKNILDALLIPEEYRGVGVVDKEVVTTELAKMYGRQSLEKLVGLLRKINQSLYNGGVPRISAYIHAPNLMDINVFIYGSQLQALEKGISVVPYISANSLNGLQKAMDYELGALEKADNLLGLKKSGVVEGYTGLLSAEDVKVKISRDINKVLGDLQSDTLLALEGYRMIKETGLTYSDYIRAELCYIELTSNTSKSGIRAIADLLEERARRGLPTYVTGKYRVTTEDSIKYILTSNERVGLGRLVPFVLLPKGKEVASVEKVEVEKVEEVRGSSVGGYTL